MNHGNDGNGSLKDMMAFWLWPTLVAAVVLFGGWYFAIGPGGLERWVLASPHDAIAAIFRFPGYFWTNASGTLGVIALGVPLSVLIGVLLGGGAALYPRLSNAVWSSLVLAQALPIFALGPVLAVMIRESLLKSLIVALLILVFPVALALYRGLKAIDRDLIDAGRLDAKTLPQMVWAVLWPLSLPSLLGGFRAALTIAPMAAFIGELAGTERGLSRIIAREMSMGRTDLVWGAVLLMILMALGLFALGAILERLIVPWHFENEKVTQ